MSKAQLNTALIALAASAAADVFQRNVMAVPVVGQYLPR